MNLLASFLSRKSLVLAQRRKDFSADPAAGVVTLKASARVNPENGSRATWNGQFEMLTDSSPGLGGQSLGPSAPELLLGSLASCLAHTYLIQAVLLNTPLEGVTVEVSGQLDMSGVVGLPYESAPRLQNIAYSAQLNTSADAADVEKMHLAVEETCPVLNSLRYPVTVERLK